MLYFSPMAKREKKKFAKKLVHKYRLVLLNEETFEERLTFKLSRLNVFVVAGLSLLVLIVLSIFLIAFTPLREYIPGYSSPQLRHQATALVYKTDSLEQVIDRNNRYFESIQHVLLGEPVDSVAELSEEDSLSARKISADSVDFAPSKADSVLRKKVAREDKYNVFDPAVDQTSFKLFPPVKGKITSGFDRNEEHYAVDISTPKNTPVKAVADGMVIFSEWTVQTGYVIILEHSYGLISVYKHNSSLSKRQGDYVRAGEVIAMTGNTGEYSTGPHLHFELWSNGHPIDPTELMDFE